MTRHGTGAGTVHRGYMPEIELRSDGTTRGVWAMFDFIDKGVESRKGYATTTRSMPRAMTQPPRPTAVRAGLTEGEIGLSREPGQIDSTTLSSALGRV